ncbi:putative small multidrug efflux protein [Gracilibacillus halophilus YIM-C55.5]|uniref:Putative small multidrug efflux protein n=1 Tax=Gracilibacillus halophilus YIM-C55.5 TaxID=1308866 RepID=N4WU73_9BACI|nr:small multi-drug export protein [Gracilibacillus halophilus]ENH96661.1 putative small multidrug efflux protein [Gracilibacillus halophilus YIM-C55.5]
MLVEYLLVFLGGAIPWFEILVVIPLGVFTGLNPALVILIGIVGNLSTLIPLVIAFEKVKTWITDKSDSKKQSKRSARAKIMWNKYGLPGMIMLGPVVLGSHLAAFIGMTLGSSKQAVLIWSTIAIVIWALVLGIATALGFEAFVPKQ